MNSNEGNDPKPAKPGPIGDPTSPSHIPPKTPGGAEFDETEPDVPANEEVAKAVLYLAADKAAWTVGSELIVDGGRSLNR